MFAQLSSLLRHYNDRDNNGPGTLSVSSSSICDINNEEPPSDSISILTHADVDDDDDILAYVNEGFSSRRLFVVDLL